MDKLEQTKTAHPDDAITDDLAAKVYVEQFASETLQRAEKAMSADKVTACVLVERVRGVEADSGTDKQQTPLGRLLPSLSY